ncbi:MAG: cyclic nucleotide-binding domain-containing protein [Actinobacteria bacterium]|nr:cyclic nucleotide-binding domain-containing protein [Actinomycetota bacterium]
MVKLFQLYFIFYREAINLNSDIIDLLRGIPLFSSLSPVFLARLSEKAVSMKFDKGKAILEEGKSCNNLFITAAGKMEAYKKFDENTELIINVIWPGRGFRRGLRA